MATPTVKLPPGFVLDRPQGSQAQGLPQGFVLDRTEEITKEPGVVSRIGRRILGEVKTPEQVEAAVAGREDILAPGLKIAKRAFQETPEKPLLTPGERLGGILGTVGGLFQRAEAAIAGPILRVQIERKKGNVPQTFGEALEEGKLAFDEFIKGVTGEQQAQLGDIFRTAGVPENVASTLGLATSMALTNLASAGRAGAITKKGIDLAKPTVVNAAKNFADDVAVRAPGKPRIFGQKWLQGFVKQGRDVTDDLQRSLGNAFDDVLTPKMLNTKVTGLDKPIFELFAGQPEFIGVAEKQLLRNMDDFFLSRFGNAKIDTVEKVRLLKDLLRSNIPKALYKGGGTIGKGVSIKLKQKGLINTLTNLEHQSLRNAGLVKEAAQLSKLNNFAHTQVYPKLDNMRVLFGKTGAPTIPSQARIERTLSLTGGLKSITGQGGGPLAKAAERGAIKEVPRLTRQLERYIRTGQYGDDLLSVVKNSKSLVKQMIQFRRRRVQVTGAVVGGLFFGGRQLFGGREE